MSVTTTVNLGADRYARLKAYAKAHGDSVSGVVQKAIDEYLAENAGK